MLFTTDVASWQLYLSSKGSRIHFAWLNPVYELLLFISLICFFCLCSSSIWILK